MRFPLAVGVLVACGLAIAAPIPKEKPKAKDEDAIQGVWELDVIDAGPGMPGPPGPQMIRFTFKAGKLEVTHPGQPKGKQGDYKLDPAAKPKAIDLVEGGSGRNSPGIYELDGDALKICLAEGQNAVRPTEFKATGNRVVVVTFKRVTDKDEKKDK